MSQSEVVNETDENMHLLLLYMAEMFKPGPKLTCDDPDEGVLAAMRWCVDICICFQIGFSHE